MRSVWESISFPLVGPKLRAGIKIGKAGSNQAKPHGSGQMVVSKGCGLASQAGCCTGCGSGSVVIVWQLSVCLYHLSATKAWESVPFPKYLAEPRVKDLKKVPSRGKLWLTVQQRSRTWKLPATQATLRQRPTRVVKTRCPENRGISLTGRWGKAPRGCSVWWTLKDQ